MLKRSSRGKAGGRGPWAAGGEVRPAAATSHCVACASRLSSVSPVRGTALLGHPDEPARRSTDGGLTNADFCPYAPSALTLLCNLDPGFCVCKMEMGIPTLAEESKALPRA